MWLFPHCILVPAIAALSDRVTANKKNNQQKCKLTKYCHMVSYLLETYVTDDVFTEAEAKIAHFKKPAGKTAVYYSEDL